MAKNAHFIKADLTGLRVQLTDAPRSGVVLEDNDDMVFVAWDNGERMNLRRDRLDVAE